MRIRKKIRTINTNPKVNLTGLNAIYNQALKDDEKTIVFELNQGQGYFVFMMFFDDDDASKDKLFIYLKRTNCMLDFKMYANHKKGDFHVYIKQSDIQSIRNELNLQGGSVPFDVLSFFHGLNLLIPQKLPFADKVNNFNRIWSRVSPHLSGVLNHADRIYFTGLMDLSGSKRKPSEKTLRKLYLYVNAKPETIKSFIEILKVQQKTCCWSADKDKQKVFSTFV